MRTSALTIGSIFLLGAYGSMPTAPIAAPVVKIVTDRSAYAPGDSALVRLTNISPDSALYYSPCPKYLERRQIIGWTIVDPPSGRSVCALGMQVLQPGSTVTFSFPLAATLLRGSYRYRFGFLEMQSTSVDLPEAERLSNTFQVQ